MRMKLEKFNFLLIYVWYRYPGRNSGILFSNIEYGLEKEPLSNAASSQLDTRDLSSEIDCGHIRPDDSAFKWIYKVERPSQRISFHSSE
jgi:hypothetical protein